MIVGLVLIGKAADVTYQNSLKDCQAFAAKFDNTCDTSKSPVSLSSMPSKDVTCDDDKLYGKCAFTEIPAETVTNVHPIQCRHSRKLCVTCSTNSATQKTEIRV